MTPEDFLEEMQILAEDAGAELAAIDGLAPETSHREERRGELHQTIKARQIGLMVKALIANGFADGILTMDRISKKLR